MSDELTRGQLVEVVCERFQDLYPHMGNKGRVITTDMALRIRLEEQTARARQLAEAVGIATTCAPSMEMDTEHPVKMMQQVCAVFADLTASGRETQLQLEYAQGLTQQLAEAQATISRLEGEKADMVLRNKLLRDRPDLPAHRLAVYDQLQTTVLSQKGEIERLREALARLIMEVNNATFCDSDERRINTYNSNVELRNLDRAVRVCIQVLASGKEGA